MSQPTVPESSRVKQRMALCTIRDEAVAERRRPLCLRGAEFDGIDDVRRSRTLTTSPRTGAWSPSTRRARLEQVPAHCDIARRHRRPSPRCQRRRRARVSSWPLPHADTNLTDLRITVARNRESRRATGKRRTSVGAACRSLGETSGYVGERTIEPTIARHIVMCSQCSTAFPPISEFDEPSNLLIHCAERSSAHPGRRADYPVQRCGNLGNGAAVHHAVFHRLQESPGRRPPFSTG